MQLVLMEWQMGLGAFCSVLLHTVRETSPSHICHLLQKLQRESSLGTDMWQNSVFPCPHPRAMAEREYPPGSAQRDSRTCCCTSRCVYDAGGFLAPSCWRWHPARTILHPSRSLCHWQKKTGFGVQNVHGFSPAVSWEPLHCQMEMSHCSACALSSKDTLSPLSWLWPALLCANINLGFSLAQPGSSQGETPLV